MKCFWYIMIFTILFMTGSSIHAFNNRQPPLRVVSDMNVGETAEIQLTDGKPVTVSILDCGASYDSVIGAVRQAWVKVRIDGQEARIYSGNYNLPVTVGKVQVDCPVTKHYYANSSADRWGLEKDVRLRFWPENSLWLAEETFFYPVRQKWFATATQMSNEPTYVDAGEFPREKVYYHSGLDFGGAEGLVENLSAVDGVVVSAGEERLPGFEDSPVEPRYDVVYIIGIRGWYYRYSHFQSIDSSIKPGKAVRKGDKLGLLGKEGGSGGWSHLHFEILSRQPSGKWGTEEGYAYLWESYVREYSPPVLAVARPHHVAVPGETVILDGGKSKSMTGKNLRYEWMFTDGSRAEGVVQKRSYDRPGMYTEVLKVTDANGNIDYDCAIVQVYEKDNPVKLPPTIHLTYAPSLHIQPGEMVTFKVRSFNTRVGYETIHFGDGSPPLRTNSVAKLTSAFVKNIGLLGWEDNSRDPLGYAAVTHRYEQPGHYLAKAEVTGENGYTAVHYVVVHVQKEKK